VACVAADLASVLGAAPDRTVWTSGDQLARRPGPDQGPRDVRDVAASVALLALSRPPGQTLSADEARVGLLVLAGRRVTAVQPALPGRPLPVPDGDRLRGHLWVDDVTVTAGSLVGAGPTGTRLVVGWRHLSASLEAQSYVVPEDAEDPYVALV
jgi:hypothetical protein